MSVKEFIQRHFRHFNAATLAEAAEGYAAHVEGGGKMLLSMAGAMSTAELGRSLAEMIRRDKVHAISCTGANLEEDLFNLVAHDHYRRIRDWRNLTRQREKELEGQGLNRVTDTCIPEEQAFRAIELPLRQLWREAHEKGERFFPHEFLYRLIREERVADRYQIDPSDSWLAAAAERELPLFVPGWEDSTLGNALVSRVEYGETSYGIVKSGLEYMGELTDWYTRTTMGKPIAEMPEIDPDSGHESVGQRVRRPEEVETTVGFFQIGGGIAGDFAICVVPLILQDMDRAAPYWGYFCQISDSTTSYGSYSGAIPSEKITWGKLDVDTPMFVIESDATIVAPLVFAYVLGW